MQSSPSSNAIIPNLNKSGTSIDIITCFPGEGMRRTGSAKQEAGAQGGARIQADRVSHHIANFLPHFICHARGQAHRGYAARLRYDDVTRAPRPPLHSLLQQKLGHLRALPASCASPRNFGSLYILGPCPFWQPVYFGGQSAQCQLGFSLEAKIYGFCFDPTSPDQLTELALRLASALPNLSTCNGLCHILFNRIIILNTSPSLFDRIIILETSPSFYTDNFIDVLLARN